MYIYSNCHATEFRKISRPLDKWKFVFQDRLIFPVNKITQAVGQCMSASVWYLFIIAAIMNSKLIKRNKRKLNIAGSLKLFL